MGRLDRFVTAAALLGGGARIRGSGRHVDDDATGRFLAPDGSPFGGDGLTPDRPFAERFANLRTAAGKPGSSIVA